MSPMPEGEQLGRPYCNNCGYSLVGLTESPRCPECGKPIVEVLMRDALLAGRSRRYTSQRRRFGLPLVQVPIGGHGHRWGGVRGLCHYLISGRGGTAIPLW